MVITSSHCFVNSKNKRYFCRQDSPLPHRTQLTKLGMLCLKPFQVESWRFPKIVISTELLLTFMILGFSDSPWSLSPKDFGFLCKTCLFFLIPPNSYSSFRDITSLEFSDFSGHQLCFAWSSPALGLLICLFLLSSVKEELDNFAHRVSLIASRVTSTEWGLLYTWE